MKIALYWRSGTRSLRRGGLRTALAVLCVAIGVMAVIAMQLVGDMVATSLTENVRALNGGDLSMSGVNLRAQQLTYFDQLLRHGTISGYTAAAADQGSARSPQPVSRFQILIVDPAHFPLAGGAGFTSPNQGQVATILTPPNIILTEPLAAQMNARVGDHFTVTLADGHTGRVTVGGILATGGLFQQPELLMSGATQQATFDEPATRAELYTNIYLDVPTHQSGAIAQVERQVRDQFPAATLVSGDDLLHANQQELTSILTFLHIVGLVTLLLASTGIINTMRVLLQRRRREIAVLKTSGYRNGDLYAMFGFEACLLGLLGGALGAAAAIGVSAVVQGVVERALTLTLSLVVDATDVASGVLLGVATTLIFGLLPIAQASQIRPLDVLRERTSESQTAKRAGILVPGLLMAALCYLLAVSIVRDPWLALVVVAAAGGVVCVLGAAFVLLNEALSRLPVVGRFPGKAIVRLSLRQLGRERSPRVMAQIALAVGGFAVGSTLLLGHGLQAQYAAGGNNINAVIWTQDLSAVEQRLDSSSAVTRLDIYRQAGFAPVALNGQNISAAAAANTYEPDNLLPLDNMLGFDLARQQVPRAPDFTLVSGRMLQPSDAGTNNVVADLDLRDAPLNLALGDQLTARFSDKNTFRAGGHTDSAAVTLTIVGFFQNNTGVESLQSTLLADNGVVQAVGGTNTLYALAIHVDPSHADSVLTALQAELPGRVFVHSYVEAFASVNTALQNLLLMLEVIVLPALLAAVINIANVVALATLNRRREVGVMKAVGYTSRDVLAGVLLEQGIAAFVASGLAIAAALVLVVLMGPGQIASGTGAPAAGSTASRVTLNLLSGVLPIAAALLATLVLLVLFLSAVVAWRATRRRPIDVLRYE